MHKFAKDPGLNEIAVRLKDVVWLEPMTDSEESLLVSRATAPITEAGAKRRRVSPLPGWKAWAVRIYLGGEQRTIGYAPNGDSLPNAMRFADMAAMYFWKYRVRGACPPEEDALNRSRADVEHDMQFETNAVGLLQDLEKYLLGAGALQTAGQRREAAKEKKVKSMRMVQGSYQAENLLHFEGLHEQLGDMAARLAALESKQTATIEVLQAIARMVEQIRSAK